jgi:outer membrane protein assembly factor BamA
MGGAVGEGSLATSGSYTYFPFRGLPVSALIGTRAMLFSAEYRFPMIDILRGLGTVPFFFKDISGAVLVDYGNAWNAHQDGCDKFSTFFSEFLMSTGVELRGDFYIGHGLPVQGRIGYAIVVVNRDRIAWLKDPILGDSIRNGMFILTLGTSF